jgi:amidase
MKLAEYSAFDALGLADLVARKEVTPKELAKTAAQAIETANPTIKAVVETYADRIDDLDESTLAVCRFLSRTCSVMRPAARSSSAPVSVPA